jgi:hypothetical protein
MFPTTRTSYAVALRGGSDIGTLNQGARPKSQTLVTSSCRYSPYSDIKGSLSNFFIYIRIYKRFFYIMVAFF